MTMAATTYMTSASGELDMALGGAYHTSSPRSGTDAGEMKYLHHHHPNHTAHHHHVPSSPSPNTGGGLGSVTSSLGANPWSALHPTGKYNLTEQFIHVSALSRA